MRFTFLFLSIFTFSNAFAQSTKQTALERFISDENLKNSSVSITVLDAISGNTVMAYDSERSLTPASSLKTLTTAAALSVLGENYKFKTELQYGGTLDNEGTLQGDIYIKGYGDPTLGSELMEETDNMHIVFSKFLMALKGAGIKNINGHIIGDGSYFPTQPNADTWLWEDMGNYYSAGIFGLNILENRYWLDFQQHPSLDSIPRVLGTRPQFPVLQIENLVTSAEKRSGDQAYIYGTPFNHDITIRGTIPVGDGSVFSIKGSIPDPVLFAAFQFSEYLKLNGINVEKHPRSVFTPKEDLRKTIYVHQSPTLSTIVKRTNHESVNLYCEAMLKIIGLQLANSSSFEDATEALINYWAERGIDTEGMLLKDGSGLSPRAFVTSRQLATILHLMANDGNLFPIFYESLSSGKEGTLKGMFRGTRAYENIHAKSGSMSSVRSYTGYARNKKGQLLSFSIIANNFTCKSSVMLRKMEALMISLCD